MLASYATIDGNKNGILPDEMGIQDVNIDENMFGLQDAFIRSAFFRRHFRSRIKSKYIANDLKNLPRIIQQNYLEFLEALLDEGETPIQCSLEDLKKRMSLIRLQHEKHEMGLYPDLVLPWNVDSCRYSKANRTLSLFDEADLLPNYPSDWIQSDSTFTREPEYVGINFNVSDYRNHFLIHYRRLLKSLGFNILGLVTKIDNIRERESEEEFDHSKAWDSLHDKIKSLKEHGNAAMKKGFPHQAAIYYDKAIVYSAVAFLAFPNGRLDFLDSFHCALFQNEGYSYNWSDLLKTLITARLNLSMAMLKPEIKDSKGACDQASLALKELRPFSSSQGKVLVSKLEKERDGEPTSTFYEAKELEAKAFFRLGSGHFSSGEYSSASSFFQKCIKAKDENNPGAEKDKVILQRLSEAKRLERKEKRRHRKKFKTMFLDHKDYDDTEKEPSSG